jgi:mannitol/fructose-specific phosphotransferase system IIA component (Ntr-type)
MALTEYLREDLVFLDLHPKDMPECIELLVHGAASAGAVPDATEAIERLLDRERTMSTGMGSGVAVPHAKTASCRQTTVALGLVPEGVDFKSIDGRPVHVVFMLLGPPDSTRQHVDLLARIAYLVKSPGVLEALRGATDRQAVLEILRANRDVRRG